MACLYLFNPDCELAIANGGTFYMPPANIVKMEDDLAYLPAYMAAKGDCLLVGRESGEDFLTEREQLLGIACREVVQDFSGCSDLTGAEPWGWSPRTCHRLQGIPGAEPWTAERKEWYSRMKAREALQELLKVVSRTSGEVLPDVCCSLGELEGRLATGGDYVVKAPWSSSGKGILQLHGGISGKEKEWISGVLRRQGYVMLEKKLDKVWDFAMEFRCDGTEVEFIGWSGFETGEKGEYKGNYLGPQQWLEEKIASYLGSAFPSGLIEAETKVLTDLLGEHYKGFFGVDMMIYREEGGELRVQPCLEINLRYNMGIVALRFSERFLVPGKAGMFRISFFPVPGEALAFHQQMSGLYPPSFEGKRIGGGYLNLTPVCADTCFVAYCLID